MSRVVSRIVATNGGDRSVFVVKYVGSAGTGYVLYQHGGGQLNYLEELNVERAGRHQRDRMAHHSAVDLIERVYAGPDWSIERA